MPHWHQRSRRRDRLTGVTSLQRRIDRAYALVERWAQDDSETLRAASAALSEALAERWE